MFNREDIVAMLKEGKTIDVIAQEAANALNEAKKQYDAEERERKTAEAAKLQIQANKRKACNEIWDSIESYYKNFHTDIYNKYMGTLSWNFDPDNLMQALDSMVDTLNSIPTIAKAKKEAADKGNLRVELNKEDAAKAIRAIDKFLSENNLF